MAMVQDVFQHIDVDGTVRIFSLLFLRKSIRKYPHRWRLTELPIDDAQAQYVIENRGVDEARAKTLPLSVINDPGIALIWPDGSLLTVDGNHRLVRRVALGMRSMAFWTAQEPVWRGSLIRI